MTRLVAGWCLLQLARLRRDRLALVVVVHGVRPGRSHRSRLTPVVPHDTFRRQLRWLRTCCVPVAARDIQVAAGRRRWGARIPVAVTVDDDDERISDLVAPALTSSGFRGTFFLTGTWLDGAPSTYWWRALETLDASGTPTPAGLSGDIDHQAAEVMAMRASARTEAIRRLAAATRQQRWPLLDAAEVSELARHHDVGFHTLEHHPLTTLDGEELATALHAGRAELQAVTGQPVDCIAYPHGAAGPRERRASAAAGLALGFTTQGVAVRAGDDPLALGRTDVPVDGAGRLLLALARVAWRPATTGR